MRFIVERGFPERYITGILLQLEFNNIWPSNRNDITRKLRCPEFKDKVARQTAAFEHTQETEQNLELLAEKYNIKIKLNKEKITRSYGQGKL